MPSRFVFLVWLALATGAAAQGVTPGVAARVNGVAISNETLDRSYREYLIEKHVNIVTARSPQKLTQLRQETLQLLIHRELARQEAYKTGVVASAEEVEAAMRAVRQAFKTPDEFARKLADEGYNEQSYREHVGQVISARKYLDRIRAAVPAVSEAELEAFYRDNPLRLTLPERVRARQILLRVPATATAEDKQAIRRRLEGILKQVRRGADFAALAKQHSQDDTAAAGGDMGFFARGQEFKPIEDAAFALKPGQVSGIVEALSGLCILRVEEREPARLLPLAEIREKLRDYLREQNEERAVADELARLYSSAKVEILAPGIEIGAPGQGELR